MNGSRSTSPRHGDRSSLDALNRTIEGLESRIEGLMKNAREPRRDEMADRREAPRGAFPAADLARVPAADPLQAIRERQRALAQAREHAPRPSEPFAPQAAPRPRLERQPAPRATESQRPAPAFAAGASAHSDVSLREIAEALVGLRQELKQDLSDGLAREMKALRTEVSSIRSVAEGQQIGDDLRHDLTRLAESVQSLGYRGGPEGDALRVEYEELRAVVDGLAREDSLRHLDARWQGFEERITDIDTNSLREELIGLAYRIDDIKSQLGSMSNSPAIQALEQKLVAVATAMEQLGSRMQPTEELNEQFAVLDERLDEISRAIAASGRAASAPAADHAALQRLENRIGGLAEQIDAMGRRSDEPNEGLSRRIEALSGRIEQLSGEEVALRLEERLEQLSHMLSQPSRMDGQAGLTEYLADISDKIDRLGDGQVNDVLAERLDYLARRIDEMDYHQSLQLPANEQAAIGRIEERLSEIATRLDETVQGPIGDTAALKSLEMQIANLSELMSATPQAGYLAPEIENRVTALESHANTNDEYIIEAARQAAEAVVESFARRERAGAPAIDTQALAGLAEDLRLLEELTRSKDERSQHTLNALHSTLVQIADRLDTMEDRLAPPMRETASMPQWQTEAAASAPRLAQSAIPAERADHSHADLVSALAGSTTHAGSSHGAPPVFEETAAPPVAVAEDGMADSTISPEASVTSSDEGEGEGEGEARKAGIFSQLSKRLRPAPKQTTAPSGRTVIDPAPSLDPVDMLPAERVNEPLEPGSGTPDVRKILERVRASQAAAGGDRAQPVSERADYIAAARRAAKAAALETDPALDGSDKGRKGKAGISALSRHRRPIMMAVGAALLALMALPLVKTLTAPEQIQQTPVAEEAPGREELPAADTGSLTPPAAPGEAVAPGETGAVAAPAGPATAEAGENTIETAPAEAAPTAEVQRDPMLEGRPAEGLASPLERAQTPLQTAEPAVVAEAEAAIAAAADPALPKIVVPASIGPQSLSKAAEAGDPVALFEIGARYTEGRGVAVDMAEAANWYKLAADRGSAPAQYRLGNLFEKGNGIARDLDKAIVYYEQAAAAGNASAMHNLAVLNASGVKGEPDYAAAVGWFTKAAELGVSDSQFNLAILYARGNGTAQSLDASYKWFAIAAKGGDQDAAQKRDEVAKAMRKEQLDAARAAAESWTPQPLNDAANTIQLPDEWAGEKPLKTSSVDMEKAIRNIQAILNKNGFDAGAPDGKMGQKTIGAIKSFQTSIGQEPSGRINDALVKELLTRNS